MTPVIKHLTETIPNLPSLTEPESLSWSFGANLKKLDTDVPLRTNFYRKVVPLHPLLNLEYSILCCQITDRLSSSGEINQEQMVEQLTAALMMSELLEQVYLDYLVVPYEVRRLRLQQDIFRVWLTELGAYHFPENDLPEIEQATFVSQRIRITARQLNPYRLLAVRSKRFLNFLDLVGTGSDAFRYFMTTLDKYANPFFAYLSWIFFIPRLTTNLFLMGKHVIPGPWMEEREESLGWYLRCVTQLQRRWPELANDVVWFSLGVAGCFYLTGALAPVGFYLTLTAFFWDVLVAGLRAYIEWKRLDTLRSEYQDLLKRERDPARKIEIQDYLDHLEKRMTFEQKNLGLALAVATGIFLAMCLAIPALAVNPIFPLIGAGLLLVIWVANYIASGHIESSRPRDAVPEYKAENINHEVSKTGFFAMRSKPEPQVEPFEPEVENEIGQNWWPSIPCF